VVTNNEIVCVTLNEDSVAQALTLSEIFVNQFPFSKTKINKSSDESDFENYRNNNFCGVCAEYALSQYLTGSCDAALLARLTGLKDGLPKGRPVDGGCDLRPDLDHQYAIDCKARRNRAGEEWVPDLSLNLILRSFELRSDKHVFVLAVVDDPLDGLDFCAVRSMKVRLIGWSRQQFISANNGTFFGDYSKPASQLLPMSELKIGKTLVSCKSSKGDSNAA